MVGAGGRIQKLKIEEIETFLLYDTFYALE